MNRLMTKPAKTDVRQAMTQISLDIRPVWSESSQCYLWVANDPMILHADSEDMPFCWFCHAQTHISCDCLSLKKKKKKKKIPFSERVFFSQLFRINSNVTAERSAMGRENCCIKLCCSGTDLIKWNLVYLSHVMTKPVFGSLWPGKTQIGLLSYRT